MYIKILIYYILGYVNVLIEGFNIEKFINSCISKKILLWNSKRTKSTILYTNIGVKDYKQAVKIAKQCKCKIKVIEKKRITFYN